MLAHVVVAHLTLPPLEFDFFTPSVFFDFGGDVKKIPVATGALVIVRVTGVIVRVTGHDTLALIGVSLMGRRLHRSYS